MRIDPEDYEPLKGFFLWMCDRVLPGQRELPEEANPSFALAFFEARSLAMARQSLALGIGDILEETNDISAQTVEAIDAELAQQGLPTLSHVRARFARAVRAILKRGSIRTETDYYALRNVVDDLPETEREGAWQILAEFERRVVPPSAP